MRLIKIFIIFAVIFNSNISIFSQDIKLNTQFKIDWIDNVNNLDNWYFIENLKVDYGKVIFSRECLQMLFLEKYYESLQQCSKEYFDNNITEYVVYCLNIKIQEVEFMEGFNSLKNLQNKYPFNKINNPNYNYLVIVNLK